MFKTTLNYLENTQEKKQELWNYRFFSYMYWIINLKTSWIRLPL